MGKMTDLEDIHRIPPKVLGMYQAVAELLEEGVDINSIRVSTITDRAGIGKGTAYEYFDTKEEIIACALAYRIQRTFEYIDGILTEKNSFQDQLELLLDETEKQEKKKFCFWRLVHMLTDSSGFSQLIRQRMASEPFAEYLPVKVFGRVLQGGVERGELRKDLPLEYMVYSLISRLLTYFMAITAKDCFQVDAEVLRPLICQGIMDELCEKNK